MKNLMQIALLFLVTVSLVAQAPKEKYPGQFDHKEPPANWMCAPRGVPKDHICDCQRMCVRDDNGNATIQADAKCTTWCWETDHCLCMPVSCGSM